MVIAHISEFDIHSSHGSGEKLFIRKITHTHTHTHTQTDCSNTLALVRGILIRDTAGFLCSNFQRVGRFSL